jgi:hypothetical protein
MKHQRSIEENPWPLYTLEKQLQDKKLEVIGLARERDRHSGRPNFIHNIIVPLWTMIFRRNPFLKQRHKYK